MVGAASVSAECSRAFLTNVTEQYLKAQVAGQPNQFTLLASNVTYLENEIVLPVVNTTLGRPVKIDLSRSYHDLPGCSAFTEFVAADPKAPYIVHTRFIATENKVSIVDSIVTKPGDWAFNATGYLHWSQFEKWEPIPKEKRDTRTVIKAAGDAYFDRFKNASVVIPFSSACARLEGGSYTARGNFSANTCDGLPSTITVTNRRYVIDEEMGIVDIFLGFPGLDRSVPMRPIPDSHVFRVEEGKIRYIHTVSHCINYNCGLNSTTFGRRSIQEQAPTRWQIQ
ncbi:hypothetical protein GQ53DRAFT_635921 [Thozetella sp. PMI_491]|nr:hypothetical protein GQ53DRAFT_635921 [Thozetella sp. PMI_491]